MALGQAINAPSRLLVEPERRSPNADPRRESLDTTSPPSERANCSPASPLDPARAKRKCPAGGEAGRPDMAFTSSERYGGRLPT
jgi:hypothetical protein